MMSYTDLSRGSYQNDEYAKQLVLFEGMNFKGSTGSYNVTPTDVDGYIQLDKENAYIFFEIKHGNPHVPYGQATAFKRLVDVIRNGGGNSAWFISTHQNNADESVIAGNTIVNRYYDGEWHRDVNLPLKQCIDNFLLELLNKEEKTA